MGSSFYFQVFPASGAPIYRQLMDQVRTLISTGKLAPNTFLPSVREVAQELEINPMTVSKAYSILERDGVLELVRGQGMRVKAPRPKGSLKDRQATLAPLLKQVVAQAYQLSLGANHVEEMLKPLLKELEIKNEK